MDYLMGFLLIILFAGWVIFMIISLITENQLVQRIKRLERKLAVYHSQLASLDYQCKSCESRDVK